MEYTHKNKGTCASSTTVTLEGGVVRDVVIEDGCDGNIHAVAALCKGRGIDEVIALLDGIRCGHKKTSCPDQLAQALKEAKKVQMEKHNDDDTL